jgi:TldD protein
VLRVNERVADFITPSGIGYDGLVDLRLDDRLPVLYEESKRLSNPVPADIGRYEVVFDAYAMAAILHGAVGEATEADRARGYEANAGGTSYLPVPEALGTQIGSPLLSVAGTRSQPGTAGHVQWDDEGVTPTDIALITKGRLMNYSTSREHVAVMSDWYRAQGIPLVSNGCCNSGNAIDVPLVYAPDVCMEAAPNGGDVASLLAPIKKGYFVQGGKCRMDHQRLTGQGQPGVMYEVKNGRIGRPVSGAAYLLRSPEFLKGIVAVGGPDTFHWRGFTTTKGQPAQSTVSSVGAVAARVRDIAVVNVLTGQQQ